MTPDALIAEAREWIGTPFHHQASVKGVGADCYGLVRGAAQAVGLVPDHQAVTGYARLPDGRMLQYLQSVLKHIPLRTRLPGDVLVFAWARDAQHMGLLTDSNTVIHAYGMDGKGGVVETSLAGRHKIMLRAAFRFHEFS